MKFRKPLSLLILAFVITSMSLYSCKDFNDVTFESDSGDADFTTVAAVGNSLAAGYQSSALYETGQRYSFPSLVAGQIETVQDFEQPLISDPGIGGRLELNGSLPPTDPDNTPVPTDEQGQPINTDLDRPYNNLGVPGSILADFTGQDLEGSTYSARRENNPFFDIILRNSEMGATQAEQLATLEPTFVMFWLGNNDILRFITSGGTESYLPVDAFQGLYNVSMQALEQTGAEAALFNIPDVASTPYVFLVKQRLMQQEAIVFDEATGTYRLVTPQGNLPIYIETSEGPRVMQENDFLLLPAASYFAGVQSGDTPPPVTPLNPIPNNLVLDGPITSPPTGASEFAQARGVVDQYNSIIASAASSNGYALVNIHARFNEILANGGIPVGEQTLRPLPGELFSFDGIHPSNQGHGVVANTAINAINETFNANIQNVDISTIPRGIPVTN